MKKIVYLLIAVALFLMLGLTSYAEDAITVTDETYFDAVLEAIPEEVKPYIEEQYTSKNLSVRSVMSVAEHLLKGEVLKFINILSKLVVLILFSAILRKACEALTKGKNICELVSFLSITVFLISEIRSLVDYTSEYCNTIKAFMSVVTLSMGGVIAIGGDVISASSMTLSVTTISLVLETLCLSLLVPVINLCIISMISSFTDKNALRVVGKLSRNFFQWFIGIVSFVSVTVFTYQSMIAQAEDSISASALRYAINGSVPFVGGAVGESLRTLTTSVHMLRSSIGALGIMTVITYSLLPLFSILTLKIALSITEEITDVLSLSKEKELLCESRKLLNMMIAVVAIVTVLHIFILSVFALIPLAL